MYEHTAIFDRTGNRFNIYLFGHQGINAKGVKLKLNFHYPNKVDVAVNLCNPRSDLLLRL